MIESKIVISDMKTLVCLSYFTSRAVILVGALHLGEVFFN